MSKRYTAGVVSSTSPTVNAAGASGVFTLNQQSAAQSTNNWPPYKVEKSLRFRSAASGYLSRTPASASNRKTWTWSGWVKRGAIADGVLFGVGTSGTSYFNLRLQDNSGVQEFSVLQENPSTDIALRTSQQFRDPAAWYHIVFALDTTQATSSNRAKLYVNGSQVTAFSSATYPTQNADLLINNNQAHNIGRRASGADVYFDGYMSEVYFIDGQALTPSSFGATDKDGNWSPIAYTGSYGTNGFYLNFKDVTSAATTGYDYSGNGNNWTLSGFNVSTANTSYDSMIDVPEDQSDGTANNRGSYAVLNPLDPKNGTQSEANLTHSQSANDYAASRSTIGMRGGKWYWEARCNTTLQSNFYMAIGITSDGDFSGYNYIGSTSGGYNYDGRATKLNNNSSSSYGATYTNGDIIGVAFDSDNGTLEFYKNGVSQGVAFTGISTTTTFYASHWLYTTSITYNFGQRPFAYAPPSGFKALNTFNLPEPTIKQPNQYFDVSLWTGNGTSQNITNSGGFAPDFVWYKGRSTTYNPAVFDRVRGALRSLYTNTTGAEGTSLGTLTAFNSNGFSVGDDVGANQNSATHVAWQWNAGGANTTNTSGSITSLVRASPTAGFSIVTFTGTGANATVGHGLGVAPRMILMKQRNGSTYAWNSYHESIGNTYYIQLNTTSARDNSVDLWNSTSPTSSVFSLSSSGIMNGNGSTYVAYCFAPIAGYSAFGSWAGNSSTDGPFIYLGFRPKFIMTKRYTATGAWLILDTSRNPYNDTNLTIAVNSTAAETTGAGGNWGFDILSNGFKIRGINSEINTSGQNYLYAAFAEAPFKYARAR